MNALKLPKGAIKPRAAVLQMAPYSPPTGGRAGKLRLDFNENTVGCSPRVIEASDASSSTAGALAVYPEYGEAKAGGRRVTSASSPRSSSSPTAPTKRSRSSSILTSTTAQEVLLLQAFLRHVSLLCRGGRRQDREIAYPQPSMEFPLQEVLDAITPETRAVLIANPNNPTGTGTRAARHRAHSRSARAKPRC